MQTESIFVAKTIDNKSEEITAMKNRADFMLTRPPDELREAEPAAEVALLCGARTRRGGRIRFCKFQHWLSRKQSTALLTAEEEEKEALNVDEAAPLCGEWRTDQFFASLHSF